MSKITRIYHRIFGSTSTTTQMAAFGSYKNSAVQMTTDASTVASLPNWLVGMSEGVVNRNAPIIEELNGVLHHSSRQIAYLLQAGVAEYDSSTEYYIDSFAVHDSLLYQSIRDNHIGYDPTSSATTWQIYPKSQYPSYATTTAFTTARGAAVEGSSFYDSTLKSIRSYLNGSWRDMQLSKGNESYATTTAFVAANSTAWEGASFYDSTLKSIQRYLNGAWRKGIDPTIQTFTSGSGTYTTPAGVKYIKVKMVGGGAGGSGGGSSTGTTGSSGAAGQASSFGSLLIAGGGGIPSTYGGGAAASITINSPALKILSVANGGFWSPSFQTVAGYNTGSAGGITPLGVAVGMLNNVGLPGPVNSGAGGAGGAGDTVSSVTTSVGAGGGAGGYIEALILNPGATYGYTVGAGGAGGASGGSGAFAGGAGAAGIIIITEYYS